MRMRPSLTADWKPSKNIELNLPVTNATRYYL